MHTPWRRLETDIRTLCKPLVGSSILSPGTNKIRCFCDFRPLESSQKIELGSHWEDRTTGRQRVDIVDRSLAIRVARHAGAIAPQGRLAMRAPLPHVCASEVGPHHNTAGQIVAKLEAISRLAGLIANPCEPLWGISSHVRQADLIREAVRREGLPCQLKSNINFDVRLLRVLVAPSRISTGLGSSQFWFIFRGDVVIAHCLIGRRAHRARNSAAQTYPRMILSAGPEMPRAVSAYQAADASGPATPAKSNSSVASGALVGVGNALFAFRTSRHLLNARVVKYCNYAKLT